MADAKYYILEPQDGIKPGQIATACLRFCAICDHTVETMGGPGRGSICPECATLIMSGQVKMERDAVLAALPQPPETTP